MPRDMQACPPGRTEIRRLLEDCRRGIWPRGVTPPRLASPAARRAKARDPLAPVVEAGCTSPSSAICGARAVLEYLLECN